MSRLMKRSVEVNYLGSLKAVYSLVSNYFKRQLHKISYVPVSLIGSSFLV